jgi:hypothetical protein
MPTVGRTLRPDDYPLIVRYGMRFESLEKEKSWRGERVLRSVIGTLPYVQLGSDIFAKPRAPVIGKVSVCSGQPTDNLVLAELWLVTSDRRQQVPSRPGVSVEVMPASDGDLRELFRSWLDEFAPGLLDQPEHVLGRAVEVLVGEVERHVLQNEALLAILDEKQQIIEQLEGLVKTLQAELHRQHLSSARVRGPLSGIRAILASATITAVAAFGGGYGAGVAGSSQATPSGKVVQLRNAPGEVGDAVRAVLSECVRAQDLANK